MVRLALPGRLHRGVHRPDPRLVLHAARAGHRAVRPARLPLLREPRHRARQRRGEDVQEPAQLPGRERGVRHVRLGRDALVPDGQSGAARRKPDRHRAGHPRRRPAGHPAAVELLVLLRAVRQRRGVSGGPFGIVRARPGPVHPGQDPYGGDRDRDPARRLQRRRRLPGPPGPPGGADQLVHPAVAEPVLGRRAGRARHALDGTGDRDAGGRAAAAADHRGDLARADRRH